MNLLSDTMNIVVLMGLCWHDRLSRFGRWVCDGIFTLPDCRNLADEFRVCDAILTLLDCSKWEDVPSYKS